MQGRKVFFFFFEAGKIILKAGGKSRVNEKNLKNDTKLLIK